MRLKRAAGVTAQPLVEKPCRVTAMPNNPLLPLLCIREDLHVLEAAPAPVSVLNPRALNLRGLVVTTGPSELSLGHGESSCSRDNLREVQQADTLGEATCVRGSPGVQ